MKRLTKAGILAIGAALVSQAAQAQFNPNDLYLGFTDPNASGDYIIDLGQAGSIIPSYSFTDLTSLFSLSSFNTNFSLSSTTISMGVVGGQNHFPSSYDLFATAPVGANLSGLGSSSTTIGFAEGALTRITTLPTAGNSVLDSNKLWSANVPTLAANDFYGASGVNPDLLLSTNQTLVEGLYEATPNNGYAYLGYFTFDSGNSDDETSLTFQAVPEPTTASILLGSAALLSILRWRAVRKNA